MAASADSGDLGVREDGLDFITARAFYVHEI